MCCVFVLFGRRVMELVLVHNLLLQLLLVAPQSIQLITEGTHENSKLHAVPVETVEIHTDTVIYTGGEAGEVIGHSGYRLEIVS